MAKTSRKSWAYGTSGTGGTPHLAGELLKQRTGIALEHIPYEGGGQAIGNTPEEFTAQVGADLARRGKVVKAATLRME